jgi:hypothetical protein
MSTRSAVLVHTLLSGFSANVLATVPAGETWILKSLLLYNGAVSASSIYVIVRDPSATVDCYVAREVVAAQTPFNWNGWVVLDAGSQIRGLQSVDGARVWASGTRLVGTV